MAALTESQERKLALAMGSYDDARSIIVALNDLLDGAVSLTTLTVSGAFSAGDSAFSISAGGPVACNDTLAVAGITTTTGGLTNPGAEIQSGVISPTAFSGNVNDYAPTGFATASVVRLTAGNSGRSITGLAGGAAGRRVTLINVTATSNQKFTLTHADSNSSAANRFACPSATNFIITNNGSAELWYDGTSSVWRVLNRGNTT